MVLMQPIDFLLYAVAMVFLVVLGACFVSAAWYARKVHRDNTVAFYCTSAAALMLFFLVVLNIEVWRW